MERTAPCEGEERILSPKLYTPNGPKLDLEVHGLFLPLIAYLEDIGGLTVRIGLNRLVSPTQTIPMRG